MRWPGLLVTLAIVAGAALRIASHDNVSARTPDERVYARQAAVLIDSGRAGMHHLVKQYRNDPAERLYPMPTRAGMIRLVASAMEWTGRRDAATGAVLSLVASIASLVVLGIVALRFLPPWSAVPALMLYAVFPPSLAVSRRTWTDALTELVAIVLVWLVCEIARKPRRLLYVAFAVVGAIGVTIKEAMPLPWAMCGVAAIAALVTRRRARDATELAFFSVAALGVAVAWMAWMAGGLADLFAVVTGIAGVNARNPYALAYATGPGYLLLQAFWIVSPVVALLALAGLYASVRRIGLTAEEWHPALFVAGFTVANVAVAMLVPHWLNLRYVAVAFGTYCLLAGIGAWALFAELSSRFGPAARQRVAVASLLLVLLAAAADYRWFHRVFVRGATADLSIRMLRDAGR